MLVNIDQLHNNVRITRVIGNEVFGYMENHSSSGLTSVKYDINSSTWSTTDAVYFSKEVIVEGSGQAKPLTANELAVLKLLVLGKATKDQLVQELRTRGFEFKGSVIRYHSGGYKLTDEEYSTWSELLISLILKEVYRQVDELSAQFDEVDLGQ
mgnify:CR=1 FL=1